MPTPLKELFDTYFFERLLATIKGTQLEFDSTLFLERVYKQDWDKLELKERIARVGDSIEEILPGPIPENFILLTKLVLEFPDFEGKRDELPLQSIPYIIENHGLLDWEESLKSIEQITTIVTCEFTVRPFFLDDPQKMAKQHLKWARHSHPRVRRLASEGCRPRLPWAPAIPYFKNNPAEIIPILEILKEDEDEWVRKSVSNNLNDISKDHPSLVLEIAKKWLADSPETKKVVKHACRTLLKKGNPEALQLFGFNPSKEILVSNFTLKTTTVKIGEYLSFSFSLQNQSISASLIRMEYAIYFRLKNDTFSKKVFKISEKEVLPLNSTFIIKRHSFKPITTRVYYEGMQSLSLIVNGSERVKMEFELKK